MYTLDTNAIIYYLKDDRNAVSALKEVFDSNVPVYISTITEAELFSFPNLAPKEINKLGDAVIAATSLFTGSTLLTRNVEDFRRIKELTIRKI